MFNEARGPFGGGSYAVSGQFKDITREKIEEFIKKSGGYFSYILSLFLEIWLWQLIRGLTT